MKNFENWQKTCVFLTRRCNLRCRGCNVVNFQSAYELTTQEWMVAFNIMNIYKVGFIVLFGGEPTLRDDLPELIQYLNRIGMPHTIITNGIRMYSNPDYYESVIKAKPFGISASVNLLKAEDKFHDSIKSEVGYKLLLRLKKDIPEADLVANIAVTRKNLVTLPEMVQHFTELGFWSILSFFHVGKKGESMYWWYRGPIDEENRELVFLPVDKLNLKAVSNWFIQNYEKLKLHNQKSYFEKWSTLGITQDWKCSTWACPAINPDGSLMACIDRPLSKPYTIFDLPEKEGEILRNFYDVISNCPGCFTGNTEVNTKEGMKKITEVKVGDKIPSYDVENCRFSESIVTKTYRRKAKVEDILVFSIGKGCWIRKLYLTKEHPLYVANRGWVLAEDVKSGDNLFVFPLEEFRSYIGKGKSTMSSIGRKRTSKRMKKDNPMSNPIHYRKMVEATRSPEVRRKKSQSGLASWKNPNKYKHRGETLHSCPNRSEKKLIEIFDKNGVLLKYNTKMRIDGKTPDFILPYEKKVVELFGVHWHKKKEEKQRINLFAQFGYQTLIIWDYELETPKEVVSKVRKFISNGVEVIEVRKLSKYLNRPLPKELEHKKGYVNVYNLECEPNHNYLIHRIVAHNCIWDHMWETNQYGIKGKAEYGKKKFAHKI